MDSRGNSIRKFYDYCPQIDSKLVEMIRNNQIIQFQEYLRHEMVMAQSKALGLKQSFVKRNDRNHSLPTSTLQDLNDKIVMPLIQYSCIVDSATFLRILLKWDSAGTCMNVNRADRNKRTALHHAAIHHSNESMEFLLSEGANVGALNSVGMTPLEEAMRSPKLSIEWGAGTLTAHVMSRLSEQDLMAEGSKVGLLAEKSKDLAVKLAFKLAHSLEVLPLMALLLVTRGQVLAAMAEGKVYSGGKEGEGSRGTLFDFLVNKVVSLPFGKAAMASIRPAITHAEQEKARMAAMDQRRQFLRMLEATLMITSRPSSSFPPVIKAVQCKDNVLLGVLLDAMAANSDVERDREGNTALHWALSSRDADVAVVRQLLRASYQVKAGNYEGLTAVHVAAREGHAAALNTLLEQDKSAVNILTAAKETPLHYAVRSNEVECAGVLLKHGANLHVVSEHGQRPGQLAGTTEMRALLQVDAGDCTSVHQGSSRRSSPPSHRRGGAPVCRFEAAGGKCRFGAKCHYVHSSSSSGSSSSSSSSPVSVCTVGVRKDLPAGKRRPSTPSSVASSSDDEECSARKVLVKGLPAGATSQAVAAYLEKHVGGVREAVLLDQCSAFVTFLEASSADAAAQKQWLPLGDTLIQMTRVGQLGSHGGGSSERQRIPQTDVGFVVALHPACAGSHGRDLNSVVDHSARQVQEGAAEEMCQSDSVAEQKANPKVVNSAGSCLQVQAGWPWLPQSLPVNIRKDPSLLPPVQSLWQYQGEAYCAEGGAPLSHSAPSSDSCHEVENDQLFKGDLSELFSKLGPRFCSPKDEGSGMLAGHHGGVFQMASLGSSMAGSFGHRARVNLFGGVAGNVHSAECDGFRVSNIGELNTSG